MLKMVCCAVFNCVSNNRLKSTKNSAKKVRFFTFPKDKVTRKLWIEKCKRKDKFNVDNARICSAHFTGDDYLLKYKVMNYSPVIKKLNRDAIPSQNLPTSSERRNCGGPRVSGIRRLKKRKLINTIDDILQKNKRITFNVTELEPELETAITELNKDIESSIYKEVAVQTEKTYEEDDTSIINRQQVMEIEKLKAELKQANDALECIFTSAQIKLLKNKMTKRIKWSADDIASAIALYAAGPRAYRLLRKRKYPLPGVSTLRTWAGKIDVNPGILNVVLDVMKKSNLSKKDRLCIILADEMKIKKTYEYDKRSDTTLKPSNYVQVIMARGIISNWKQPIYYNYDTQLSKDLIFDLIKKLEAIGYPVVGITTDLGGGNRGVWKDLDVSITKTYFMNRVNDKKVYVFGDVPHLIKLLRNHFLDSGFMINRKIIDVGPIAELFRLTSQLDLNIAHKIKDSHLTCKKALRQKVKLATQLFSHTVSSALTRAASLGISKSPNVFECADLVKKVNDWFDVFNSKMPANDARDRIKAYGLSLETQNKILEEMKNVTLEMRVLNRKSLLPFQNGILMSISSLKLLFSDLQTDYDIKYLLTYRLNQDPLEGFFSIMRAIGGLHDHPTALEFKHRLRNYILGRNDQVISQSANIEASEPSKEDTILGLPQITLEGNEIETTETITVQLLSNLQRRGGDFAEAEKAEQEISELQYDGLENLAGYIAFKLKDQKLGVPTDKICDQGSQYTWVSHLSEGGLYKPTENFMCSIRLLDNIFNEFNKPSFQICRGYIQQLMNLAQLIDLSNEAKNLFFRCKMFFKMRKLNKDMAESSTLRKRKVVKITN